MSTQTKTRIRLACCWLGMALGLVLVGAALVAFVFAGSPTPAEARSVSEPAFAPALAPALAPTVTPTSTVRPVPTFLIKGVTDPSPKVDGVIGGEQVNLKADLPVGNQSPRPIFGDLFKFMLQEDSLRNDNPGSSAVYVVSDSNGDEVYRHVEHNLPFCPFSDTNGRCNQFPVRDGVLIWPESEGRPSQPVQPGRYFLSARIEGDGGGVICRTIEDYAFDISVRFDAPSTPAVLPASAGVAVIRQPANRAVLRGIVNIAGSADVRNFWYYKFEFVDSRCANGVCFVADARRAVRNGILLQWDTRSVPNGTYVLRLVVVDTSGRVLSTMPRITITIQN